jgi:7-alpha-hydroxysteroid dehydrogenase
MRSRPAGRHRGKPRAIIETCSSLLVGWAHPSERQAALILDRFRVDGQVAVVTGAGRGIGAAAAIALAEAGADVVISARTKEQLEDVAGRAGAVGRRALIVPADLSDLDAAAGLPDAAVSAFGRLDIVVNNVGGSMPRPFLATKPRHLEKAFQFNVEITHALTQAAVPHLLASAAVAPGAAAGASATGGSATGASATGADATGATGAAGPAVINISSVVGRVTGRGYLAYGTAKAALAHYTRLAASDLAPRIRVNAIAVGSVATSALEIVLTDDNLRGQMEDSTPLGMIGDPEDVAAAVVFLASPASRYVTGKILEVDGGLERPNLDLGLPDL